MSSHQGNGRIGGRQVVGALELLVDVLSSAGSEDAGFYSHLAEAVCRVAGMRRAIIFRFDESTRSVRLAGSHGIEPELIPDRNYSLEDAPEAARALGEDRVIEVRPPEPHVVAAELMDLVSEHPLVYVPISAADRWPGVMIVEPEKEAAPLTDTQRDLLWTLGKTLALASMARIATFHGERARQLEDRIDLARDIHDRVIQRLFGVSLALSTPSALDDEALRRCADEVQTALADLRSALQRPLGRKARDTGTTLATQVARLAEMQEEIRIDGPVPEVPADLEALAQSVLAEAVRNVRKHAAASALVIRVRRASGLFTLEVENDGVGERPRTGPPGMGLRLAALEALHAGGLVEFGRPEPGKWRVRLAVPELQMAQEAMP